MKRPLRNYLLVALCLSWATLAVAEEPIQSEVVPVDHEPRHRLALENQYVRVLDVRIPPGDTTRYHRHQRDSLYVIISGASKLVTEEFGKPAKPVSPKPGDVSYREHLRIPLTHRVSNLSTDEFHVLDIEIVANPAASSAILAPLPTSRQPLLDNARVRVSRIVLEPGQSSENDSASPGLLVVLAGIRLGITNDSGTIQRSDVTPGQFYARTESVVQRIQNEGDDRLELISIEIK